MGSVLEPNGVVVITDEDTLHSDNLNVVKLLQVVAHLVNLLHAVPLWIIVFDQINVLFELLVVILYFGLRLEFPVYFCEEVDDVREATANF